MALRVGPKGLVGKLVAAYVGLRLDLSRIGCGLMVGLLLLYSIERWLVFGPTAVSLVR